MTPEHPDQDDSTQTLKEALARLSRDARRYAHTGPKVREDAAHQIADQFLDELRRRGEA